MAPFLLTVAALALFLTALPGRAASDARVLNNFVTELVNVEPGDQTTAEFPFSNPRDGWIYVASTARAAAGEITISVPQAPDHLVFTTHRPGTDLTQEAIHFLPRGDYRLRVECAGEARLERLIVRAVPEILYSNFESHAHVGEYPRYTWEWLRKVGLLDNLTTIIGTRSRNNEAPREEWRAAGRRWIVECGVPGVGVEHDAAHSYDYWRAQEGMSAPGLDGLIADEFYPSLERHYPGWIDGIRRLGADPALKGRVFYPYCAGDPQGLAPLVQATVDSGYRFAYERYLKEKPTEAEQWQYLRETLVDRIALMKQWVPDAQRHCIFVLGLLTAPPESNNTNPRASFKTHLDMLMWLLANDPELEGVYGVMEYLSAYADEEYLRWYGRLCRHYCIEGNRERLSTDPYILDHIDNPDFADGLRGWTVSAAAPDSIQANTFDGLGWLQGRYPRDEEGDVHLLLKRSADRPNVVSQTLLNLEPGRAYSVKMYACDRADLLTQKDVGLSLRVEGADPVAERSFVHVYHNCYSHWLDQADQQEGQWKWFNYHFQVFRAQNETAELIISDWRAGAPGGDPGAELALNFIEVEPYYE